MTQPIAKRFPTPALDKLPDDIRDRILAVQEKSGFVPNVFLTLAYRPDEFRAFFAYHDALDGQGRRPDQGRARDDRGRHFQRQSMPLLRRRARRHPAHPRQEPADRRPDRHQLPQGGYHAAPASDARFRHEGERRGAEEISEQDFADISPATVSATTTSGISRRFPHSFALSNRMANVTGMRPNDEFYMMGRLPK